MVVVSRYAGEHLWSAFARVDWWEDFDRGVASVAIAMFPIQQRSQWFQMPTLSQGNGLLVYLRKAGSTLPLRVAFSQSITVIVSVTHPKFLSTTSSIVAVARGS